MQLFTGIKVMSQFLSELIKNPRFIRAVAPSSQSLAEKMIEKIDFKQILCIIGIRSWYRVIYRKINCQIFAYKIYMQGFKQRRLNDYG